MGIIKVCFLLILFGASSALQAQSDSVLYGRNHYTAYFPGDLPLIISAPHGGSLTPNEIPDRTYGVMTTDDFTLETALAIRSAVWAYSGHYPHVIVSYLKRTKLDPNRSIDEAAQGNAFAEQAWYEYHNFIDRAEDSVSTRFGKGFYIDIHGHGHPIHRLELGYLLSASVLNKSDQTLNNGGYASESSIRALAEQADMDFAGLLRGYYSLGSLIARQGIRAVPSKDEPNPGSGNPYFSGGYSTKRHGSRDGGRISGVQIEAYRNGLRDTPENRAKYARALTLAINQYFQYAFGWNGLKGQDSTIIFPPAVYKIGRNHPNPFSNSTIINYALPLSVRVSFSLYNVLGKRVLHIAGHQEAAGLHQIKVNGKNLAGGVYLYRLHAGDFTGYGKMIILH